ncbi:endonuclease/exonuclease/phosphatase family protein [Schlesneria paludicola]|uniref:endonuclease/exonuclease/phosphatase family protein n=1 Tax=Schlesneria paludicola TaxID=360056 RepID=UPI0012FA8E1B|nr:endonuclease/exonuclease/phosphatase family protein [Schlesneria paludicola]
MAREMRDTPMTPASTVTSPRWKAVVLGLTVTLVGLIAWDGAERRPADMTSPLPQSVTTKTLRQAPARLTLASFNIHSGKGTDGVRDLSRIAKLLEGVDFAGLYEVRAQSDARQPNQAAALVDTNEGGWVFAPTEQQWWSDQFGNGLIHRIPVNSVLRIPLVNTRGKAYRNAILANIKLQATDVRVIAVHIDREKDRRQQLQAVIDLFQSLQPPCILMGDLNTTADDPLLVHLRESPGVHSPLHDSIPDTLPSQGIDWIFTRGLKTISAALINNSASDHPLLRAELEPTDAP